MLPYRPARSLQGLEACLLALICCALWIARATARAGQGTAAGFRRATAGLRCRAAAARRRLAARTRGARAGAARAGRWLTEPVTITRGQMLAVLALTVAVYSAALLAALAF